VNLFEALTSRGLSKFERISFLRDLGLNTPDYRLVSSPLDLDSLRPMASSIRTLGDGRRIPKDSFLREIMEEDFYPPHLPVVEASLVKRAVGELLRLGWKVIICPVIDPRDAVLAGIAASIYGRQWPRYYSFRFEVAYGQVMVRVVSHGKRVDGVFILPEEFSGAPMEIKEVYRNIIRLRRIPVLLEFSYYRKPIGWKREHIVFWDIHFLEEGIN